MRRASILAVFLVVASCGGGSDSADGGAGGSGGQTSAGGSGGQTGAGGSGGTTADARPADAPASTDARGDGPGPDVTGTPGGPMGTQPLGSACANTGNCTQASGMAVCCVNTCTLVEACPSDPGYLPCMKKADCDRYGGGKVCCQAGSMTFCTKQSACGGTILP
jgi:hypothetical protein